MTKHPAPPCKWRSTHCHRNLIMPLNEDCTTCLLALILQRLPPHTATSTSVATSNPDNNHPHDRCMTREGDGKCTPLHQLNPPKHTTRTGIKDEYTFTLPPYHEVTKDAADHRDTTLINAWTQHALYKNQQLLHQGIKHLINLLLSHNYCAIGKPKIGTEPLTADDIAQAINTRWNLQHRYPMCKDQLAQIDCRNTRCKYHVDAQCTNISPAITLNPNGKWVCWSEKGRTSTSSSVNESTRTGNILYCSNCHTPNYKGYWSHPYINGTIDPGKAQCPHCEYIWSLTE